MQDNPPVDLDEFRKDLLKYTRKVYRLLPKIEHPRILDIGCGTGVPTMELARLSNGEVLGIDIDKNVLKKLDAKIKKVNLCNRVSTQCCSIVDMHFPNGYFDIIWAEGSVFVLGFKKSLKQWQRFLQPGGFCVLHDEAGDLSKKLHMIPRLGYNHIDHLLISSDIWWKEYYEPLQKKIHQVRDKNQGDAEAIAFIDARQAEIDTFKKNRKANESVYIILQKPSSPLIY
jgi:ubiquinone/menaquinone biosynthesis C-methylase UbiE